MKYEYRIKVEVDGNDNEKYTPQIGIPKIRTISRFVNLWLKWENLYPELEYKYIYDPTTQKPISKETIIKLVEIKTSWSMSFQTEKEADDVVEFFKEQERKIDLAKTKKTYFINK